MNRQLITVTRVAAGALAIAAAAAISIGGAGAAQASEPHPAVGSTAQLHTDGYGIGGLAVSVEASVQTDIQKPGH